ncbi:HAMP domain-containing sensor histidine kinase [Novosphingobium sp. 9U]|uniref:sensor histidine kinase n=1 Tax=Novosphingobium sp. 9U TaxID=2653158 RepID=UPI0012F3EC14|nr:sensor histidine kinase [Novosphingobium sp. 9U]VWX51895.1 conserved hypothetical protein [Novosphingobium sp. 9U]
MHFDDRLATVLQMPIHGPAMARIQFRQLLDLLAQDEQRAEHSEALDAAFARLEELSGEIAASERAAILREPMMRIANPELVGHLATAEPEVATAAIAAAELSDADWLDIIPALPVAARGILRHRAGFSLAVLTLLDRLGIQDRGLPSADVSIPERSRPELVVLEGGAAGLARAPMPEQPDGAGIGAIVRRIEEFRKARASDGSADANQQSLESVAPTRATVLAADFATDPRGRIDWAEGALGSSLVGTMLGGLDADAADLGSAIRLRQPLRNVVVTLFGAPDLAGEWRLDALPQFAASGGAFVGYAGRLRRSARVGETGRANEGDSMRQVLHELRTPANAIQIAAEIIQQQLYGPAPHEYRALAASIAGDTAQILAGFDELDRLVKLENGSQVPAAGECDLSVIVEETVARLQAWTAPHGSGFVLPDAAPSLTIGIEEDEIARLVWRVLAGLAGLTAPGEHLQLELAREGTHATLAVRMPDAMIERLDAAAISGQPVEGARSLSSGMFGIGFTLRLAAAEAAAAGGALRRVAGAFHLSLPGLTPAAVRHTHR